MKNFGALKEASSHLAMVLVNQIAPEHRTVCLVRESESIVENHGLKNLTFGSFEQKDLVKDVTHLVFFVDRHVIQFEKDFKDMKSLISGKHVILIFPYECLDTDFFETLYLESFSIYKTGKNCVEFLDRWRDYPIFQLYGNQDFPSSLFQMSHKPEKIVEQKEIRVGALCVDVDHLDDFVEKVSNLKNHYHLKKRFKETKIQIFIADKKRPYSNPYPEYISFVECFDLAKLLTRVSQFCLFILQISEEMNLLPFILLPHCGGSLLIEKGSDLLLSLKDFKKKKITDVKASSFRYSEKFGDSLQTNAVNLAGDIR